VLRSPFIAGSQLVVQPDGHLHITPPQLRAIRAVVLRPDLPSMLAMVREMATPGRGGTQTIREKCTVWGIRLVEAVLHLLGMRTGQPQ
jgi:hypothetical protein